MTLERDTTTLFFKRVPAEVCDNCGEEYIDEDVTVNLRKTAETATRDGVQFELRRYATA